MNLRKKLARTLMITGIILSLGAGCALSAPISIAEQGSFTVGGRYKQHEGTFSQDHFIAEDGQRAYGDFAYVEYQKPEHAKKLPLIFQHEIGRAHV